MAQGHDEMADYGDPFGTPMVASTQFVPVNVTGPESIVAALEAYTFNHSRTGPFQIFLTVPDHQIITAVTWEEGGRIVGYRPDEYIITTDTIRGNGRLVVGPQELAGYLFTERGDVEIVGKWEVGGIAVTLFMGPAAADGVSLEIPHNADDAASPETHTDPDEHADDESGAGDWDPPSQCDPLESVVDAFAACVDAEETVLAGDEQFDEMMPVAPQAPTVKVHVYYEGSLTRAQSNCLIAGERIYESEMKVKLECEERLETDFDGTGTTGEHDWRAFLANYFLDPPSANQVASRNYNAGRFVAFLSDDTTFGNSGAYGLARSCHIGWSYSDEPGGSETAGPTRACGHFGMFTRGNTAWFVHSASYREAQTFAHELLHVLDIDIGCNNAEIDKTNTHDCTGRWVNSWFYESCDELKFKSRNVFYPKGGGADCKHRHFWITERARETGLANAGATEPRYPNNNPVPIVGGVAGLVVGLALFAADTAIQCVTDSSGSACRPVHACAQLEPGTACQTVYQTVIGCLDPDASSGCQPIWDCANLQTGTICRQVADEFERCVSGENAVCKAVLDLIADCVPDQTEAAGPCTTVFDCLAGTAPSACQEIAALIQDCTLHLTAQSQEAADRPCSLIFSCLDGSEPTCGGTFACINALEECPAIAPILDLLCPDAECIEAVQMAGTQAASTMDFLVNANCPPASDAFTYQSCVQNTMATAVGIFGIATASVPGLNQTFADAMAEED